VFQYQPGLVCTLPADDSAYLAGGPVDPEIVESFARLGPRLSPDATVRYLEPGAWQLVDAARGWDYRLVVGSDGIEVLCARQTDEAALAERLQRCGHPLGGQSTDAVRRALRVAGGDFLVKLAAFRPHVVGFRLEAGGFEQVQALTAAVRLFSRAEVVIGGPTATSHPIESLLDCGADYVFAGEAEEPFNQFLRLAPRPNSRDLAADIPGLAYCYGNRAYHNTLPRDGYGRNLVDVDRDACRISLSCARNLVRPVAGREVVGANQLRWKLIENFQREFDSLFFTGGRGCPGACTFCAKLHGQEVRAKSAEQILGEIEAVDREVASGRLRLTRWRLFEHLADPTRHGDPVAWAAIYDEDFFLNRRRAIEFFKLWSDSPLNRHYRLSVQTNPCSMLTSRGVVHEELLQWIDRLKPMVQLGAESFNDDVLRRWSKRHNLAQLNTVLDALDTTGQDYTVFQLLTDFDTTPQELVETLRLLVLAALKHPRMRVASNPYTIPLYDSETRQILEYRGWLTPERVRHFTDYERIQPGWMEPLVAELADQADAELQWSLMPHERDAALVQAMEVVRQRIRAEFESRRGLPAGALAPWEDLDRQVQAALGEVKDTWYRRAGAAPWR